MFSFVATGAMAISFLAGPVAAPPTLDAPIPPAGQIHVEVVAVNGSGCRPGTAVVAAAPDNTAFTVTYSDYMAHVGVGSRPIDFRKNCQMGVRVDIPQGFTYAIAQADYRGYAKMARGASGMERANYYFQGMSGTAISSHSFNGPYNGGWQATDRAGVAALVFKPCGEERILNINTEIIVDEGTSNPRTTTSMMTMDSADGSMKTVYHIAWKRCR